MKGISHGLDNATFTLRTVWASPSLVLFFAFMGIASLLAVIDSAANYQIDPKGCRMSFMRPSYVKFHEFDAEYTRSATKYSLYLYREQGIEDETEIKLRGVPVLFIPGNAGSYKQVRPIAAEAANYYHDGLHHHMAASRSSILNLDFFTVDFNEDITAFHGQTLLDQAEYLNEAIRYILTLYLDPDLRIRDFGLPDPTSVIILGHSMGGVVARTMLAMPNYQAHSINTIITMSAPHSHPPVTFDGQTVQIYDEVNNYWRRSHSQKWANNNPLWHVILISIAGGGLDTVVPSDYASIESLVPETHGFTVFTSTIPSVWTSMDHQAILWCDQFRKVATKALFEIVDVRRASQTKPRAERMRVFRENLLSGLEPETEKNLVPRSPSILYALPNDTAVVPAGERVVLRRIGTTHEPSVFVFSIRDHLALSNQSQFTLLTDIPLNGPVRGSSQMLEIELCSSLVRHSAQSISTQPHSPNEQRHSALLSCKSSHADLVTLPASTQSSTHPFADERGSRSFFYLKYDLDDILDYDFVVIISKATSPSANFVTAGFGEVSNSSITFDGGIWRLLYTGARWQLSRKGNPLVFELSIPSATSSLLAYHMEINSPRCDQAAVFAPLLRQYINRPHESKYFVNVSHADINFHGEAPYLPPALYKHLKPSGVSFQLWADSTCDSDLVVTIAVDLRGSLGKLYMRYRTILIAFPLFVVALVLLEQFRTYNKTGVFISFSRSLENCLCSTIPFILLLLTGLSVGIGSSVLQSLSNMRDYSMDTIVGTYRNDLLMGTQDPTFWPLILLVGIISIGVCVGLHYVVLILTSSAYVLRGLLSSADTHSQSLQPLSDSLTGPGTPSNKRRLVTTGVLLLLVATMIPYQSAFLVACIMQMSTTAKALSALGATSSRDSSNFYHYCHSILLIMLWILPVNLPTVAVWIRDLTIHWLTPFSSHHNVWSILPFIMLIETLASGKMVPLLGFPFQHVTSLVFLGTAIGSCVYGVSYAYKLHQLVNMAITWLVVVHAAEVRYLIKHATAYEVAKRGFALK